MLSLSGPAPCTEGTVEVKVEHVAIEPAATPVIILLSSTSDVLAVSAASSVSAALTETVCCTAPGCRVKFCDRLSPLLICSPSPSDIAEAAFADGKPIAAGSDLVQDVHPGAIRGRGVGDAGPPR